MKEIKEFLVAIGVLIGIVIFAIIMTYNIKDGQLITISLDNQEQLMQLTKGHPPDTSFVSVQDTPFGDNIKILRVDTHFAWGEGYSVLDKQIEAWLDSIGVKYYDKFNIQYKGS